jgi:alpha-galactosidase
MTKIAFIGAGSLGFTGELVRDILTFPLLEDATISLMDINPERLAFAKKAVEKLIAAGKRPAKVEATTDRAKALKDADFVLTTILSGSTEVWRHDIEIPKKYGVDINVGDTRGPSGIFRFLRTLSPMQDIVRDMEKVCPNAVLLNYTNPMAMLCAALQRQTFLTVTGLCHSVQGTAMMLAEWIGAPFNEIDYVCAGINHQAWYLDYKWNGRDAYPLIYKAITERKEIYNEEIVRNEMYLAFGKYVTESSGHNSEYNWWFRKRPDLIEKYCTHGTGWNPGEYAYILKEYQETEVTWKDIVKKRLDEPLTAENLQREHEYAAFIINALKGGEMFKFNGMCATPI